MSQLFRNRIENLISVIDLDFPKICLDTLGKSDLEHLYGFAYASVLRQIAGLVPAPSQAAQKFTVGASPVMLISLQKGGIDAAMLQDPFSFAAEDEGFKVLGDPETVAESNLVLLTNLLDIAAGGHISR